MPDLTAEEARDLGDLESLVPLLMFWPWRYAPRQAQALHDTLTVEILSTVYGTFPGGPTGAGGHYNPADLATPDLIDAAALVCRLRSPSAATGA